MRPRGEGKAVLPLKVLIIDVCPAPIPPRAHALFRHPRGDHITYLMIYAAWEQRGFSEDW